MTTEKIFTPFTDKKWLIFGDECGPKIPNGPDRYLCYSMVAIPKASDEAVKKELPLPATKRGFAIEQFDAVYGVLAQNGGLGLCVYFDMHNPNVVKDVAARLHENRKQSNLGKPPSIDNVIWAEWLGFAFLEILSKIALRGLPVEDCYFKYHDRSLHEHVLGHLPHLAKDVIGHIQRIITEVAPHDKAGILKSAKPQIRSFEAGKTREAGIRIADLCAYFANLRLNGKITATRHDLELQPRTHILTS